MLKEGTLVLTAKRYPMGIKYNESVELLYLAISNVFQSRSHVEKRSI